MYKIIITLITIIASIIGIFVFMTGYAQISEALPDFSKIPLFRTILSNQGWINLLTFSIILIFISEVIKKKNRFYLSNIISNEKQKWNIEQNSAKILRDLKKLDFNYAIITQFSMLIVYLIFSIILYHSDISKYFPQKSTINLDGSYDTYITFSEQNSVDNKILIEILGKVSKKSEYSLLYPLSIIPDGIDVIKFIKYDDNGIEIILTNNPTIIINNLWIFLFLLVIMLGVTIDFIDSIFKLKILLIIKKLSVDKKKILKEMIIKYDFKSKNTSNIVLKNL